MNIFVTQLTYLPLFRRFELVSTDGIVGNIERMVLRRYLGIEPALDDERVSLPPDYVNFWDQETINIPGYSPTDVTCKTMATS